jgi:hypothetical protein
MQVAWDNLWGECCFHFHCCTSSWWPIVMTVEHLVEWRSHRGSQSIRRKPALMPTCQPEILHDLTRTRTRAAAVGNRRLAARATARPSFYIWQTHFRFCNWIVCIFHFFLSLLHPFSWFNYFNKKLGKNTSCKDRHEASVSRFTALSGSLTCRITKKELRNCYYTSSMALSPRANYTDWATATCRRNLVPTFVDRGVSRLLLYTTS